MTETTVPLLLTHLGEIEQRLESLTNEVRLLISELERLQESSPSEEETEEPFDVLQARAIDRAKRHIAEGDTTPVLAALDKAGADRVSTLDETNIRIFLEALHD